MINRCEFLNGVIPSVETSDAIYYLQMALFCFEARAYRRKQQKLNKKSGINEYEDVYKDIPFSFVNIETMPVSQDGHIILK